ncbi:MAG TPA: 3-isopropylmalate dehydrogenase [Polyangiaceae bacterium]|jgi:3-isopropylmalate dehydrogenase|nr:3-isopropylmalate dehydrogenase [Polyangiaceae bacterium]
MTRSDSVHIVSLPGDGIGPEVCREGVRVLELACKHEKRKLEVVEMLLGGCALDLGKPALPDETKRALEGADAVLLGAVGLPKYDGQPGDRRPEKGLLDLRKLLGVYANLRPVRAFPMLAAASPLKEEILRGTDMVVVRELLGDVYFGEPRGFSPEGDRAFNTMTYSVPEVERVTKVAFEMARKRRKLVTSVDKANVLEASQLWRRVVTEMGKLYPDVKLEHQYVDSCAMDLIKKPSRFDVVVTSNLFGDILTDEASVLAGSIGLLPSASLGDGPGLFEPIHGSAPDIAGKGIANPLGTIASVAMMLRSSLGMPEQAERLERAIEKVLEDGHRTADLGGKVTTSEMGDLVCRAFES